MFNTFQINRFEKEGHKCPIIEVYLKKVVWTAPKRGITTAAGRLSDGIKALNERSYAERLYNQAWNC